MIMKTKIKLQKRGFTLIEMMVAMSIFVIFIGVIIQSYLSIITSQREANEYRAMYSEARYVFDKVSDEIRNGVISYDQMGVKDGSHLENPVPKLVLFSPDQTRAVLFQYSNEKIGFAEFQRDVTIDNTLDAFQNQFQLKDNFVLNSERIKAKDLNMYVSPVDDPYRDENVVKNGLQYQPKVTLFATFAKEIRVGKTIEFNLQTTISSRSYVPGYVAPFLRGAGVDATFANLDDTLFNSVEGDE